MKISKERQLFDNRALVALIIPLIIEQFLAVLVGMADSIMVASVGEAAVSGVSLVDNIVVLLINIFSALATGGAVVAGQYLGRKREEEACKSAGQLVWFVTISAVGVTAIVYLCKSFILHGVFGKIEADVMEHANTYLLIVTASIPFIALYNGGAAIFRAMGDSKIPMIVSMIMNVINVSGNAILIYGFHCGTEGVAIPTLVSRAVAAILITILLCNSKRVLHLEPVVEDGRDLLERGVHARIDVGVLEAMVALVVNDGSVSRALVDPTRAGGQVCAGSRLVAQAPDHDRGVVLVALKRARGAIQVGGLPARIAGGVVDPLPRPLEPMRLNVPFEHDPQSDLVGQVEHAGVRRVVGGANRVDSHGFHEGEVLAYPFLVENAALVGAHLVTVDAVEREGLPVRHQDAVLDAHSAESNAQGARAIDEAVLAFDVHASVVEGGVGGTPRAHAADLDTVAAVAPLAHSLEEVCEGPEAVDLQVTAEAGLHRYHAPEPRWSRSRPRPRSRCRSTDPRSPRMRGDAGSPSGRCRAATTDPDPRGRNPG